MFDDWRNTLGSYRRCESPFHLNSPTIRELERHRWFRQLSIANFFEVRCHSRMRFEVKLRGEVIGFSELEGGDPPMGVAFGRLLPTPAYTSIRPYCIEHRDYWKLIPELTVQESGGVPIECSGGVQIIDFSPELGEEGIQVHVNGIPYPLYGELFPQHVALYREQFK